jgi:two-component system phosphate regulon sensor histidine kinase PhoR
VILGSFILIGLLAFQILLLFRTWKIRDIEFDQAAQVALQKTAEDLAEFNESILPNVDLIKRLSHDYYVVNINDIIDAGLLEFYLRSNFQKARLNTDFEYAIYNCNTLEMEYGNYCSWEDKVDIKMSEDLPRYADFTYYFGLRFPNRRSFEFSRIPLALVIGVVLSIVLLFFAYAMYVLLQQKRLSELQIDFINNLTHEFRTPITGMLLAVRNLRNLPGSGKEHVRYAEMIEKQAKHLNQNVDHILSASRWDSRRITPDLEVINLHSFLSDLFLASEQQFQNLAIELEVPDDISIQADGFHLANIFQNLADNAAKHSGQPNRLVISALRQSGKIQVKFQDFGKGINPSHLKNITKKFYRVPTGNISKSKGFGLGLFYVRNACKAHGWKLDILSKSGDGTAVLITMPANK